MRCCDVDQLLKSYWFLGIGYRVSNYTGDLPTKRRLLMGGKAGNLLATESASKSHTGSWIRRHFMFASWFSQITINKDIISMAPRDPPTS